MSDLEQDTQSQMFQKELLKLEPKSITTKGRENDIFLFTVVKEIANSGN